MKTLLRFSHVVAFTLMLSSTVFAADQTPNEFVKKYEFKMSEYITEGGKSIKNLKVGYEYYGTLNKDKSNVILITHHFSGNSHAAGKYTSSDAAAGYWDSLIGPNKAIDTNKYFVISSDTLVNINPKDPRVITTGPLSINPETGATYGTSFPVVTYGDFVKVQKALLDTLGIEKLVAVVGPSAGSMQALQWAADYPEMVERVVAVISPGLSTPAYTIGVFNGWATPIMMDPKWNNGAYEKGSEPVVGLANAFKAVTVSTVDFAWAEKNFGTQPADPAKSPLESILNPYLVEAKLQGGGNAKTTAADANSFLYMVRASQAYNVESKVANIKAPVLFISSATDALFPPALAQAAAEKINAAGGTAKVSVLNGVGGHLVGILAISNASAEISEFLK